MIPMMKSTGNSNEYEPTLLDVLEAVQSGFQKMEGRFGEMGERFNDLGSRVTAVEKRVGTVEVTLEEMAGTLSGIEHAVDKDAVTIVDHGRRIARLEEARV